MKKILLLCVLTFIACDKDKAVAPVPLEELEILLYYDGWDGEFDLGDAPIHIRLLDRLTNIEELYDARDMYTITTSQNGRVFVNLENVENYPVPMYIWLTDVEAGLIRISHFGLNEENLPIDTLYYANRNLLIGVAVDDAYRGIPPDDPTFMFNFSLEIMIP